MLVFFCMVVMFGDADAEDAALDQVLNFTMSLGGSHGISGSVGVSLQLR